MRKNGFTLIELLAVIVILAIIALIATPIILGIINDAREKANERSVELYASAVKNAIASYQLTHPNAPESFEDLDVQYDGDVECSKEELYSDGSFYLEGCKVNNGEKEYSYGTKQGLDKACTLEDKDGDGVASLSDVVTCGTEQFHVMFNENNEVTMLSMYNLYVGNSVDGDAWETSPLENPTNMQSEIAKGEIFFSDPPRIYYGTTGFSNTDYWSSTVSSYPTYVYNQNNDIIYLYVREYERILKENLKVNSAQASLISYEQLVDLGCDSSKSSCGPNVGEGELENPAPSWVYSTSYWTGSAHDVGRMWYVGYRGEFHSCGILYNGIAYADIYGVRPVITISTSEIQ